MRRPTTSQSVSNVREVICAGHGNSTSDDRRHGPLPLVRGAYRGTLSRRLVPAVLRSTAGQIEWTTTRFGAGAVIKKEKGHVCGQVLANDDWRGAADCRP